MNRTKLAVLSVAACLLTFSAAVSMSTQKAGAPQASSDPSSTSTRVGRKMTATGTITFRRARR